jgi:hypothetical protein
MRELVTREEFSERFLVARETVDKWRYGHGGILVPLPYLRLGGKVWLWEGGIIWWINKQSERPDYHALDRIKRLEKKSKKIE